MDRWSNLTYHSGHSGRNCLTDFITIVNMVDLLLVNNVASNYMRVDDAPVILWSWGWRFVFSQAQRMKSSFQNFDSTVLYHKFLCMYNSVLHLLWLFTARAVQHACQPFSFTYIKSSFTLALAPGLLQEGKPPLNLGSFPSIFVELCSLAFDLHLRSRRSKQGASILFYVDI